MDAKIDEGGGGLMRRTGTDEWGRNGEAVDVHALKELDGCV